MNESDTSASETAEPVKTPDKLERAAKELVKKLNDVVYSINRYYAVATAIGHASGNAVERGFSSRQVRQRVQAEVIARLSPRNGVLALDGAPEARRYTAAQPLPGL